MLTVAKLAARADLSPDAVRYYERSGLLAPPERTKAGYRQYDESLVERLRFIKGAQRTGLKLRQIRDLLDVIDRGMCPCGHTQTTIEERIAEIDREVKQLRDVRKQLVALKEDLPAPGSASDSEPWPCERTFIEAGRNPKGANRNGKATS